MDPRTLKDTLYTQFALIGKAISSPKRLELLDLLCQGEKTVETLVDQADLTVGNTSAHLKALRAARLVEARKEGQHVYYRLSDESIGAFLLALRSLAEKRLAEVRDVARDYFSGPHRMTPIGRRTLLERARRGEVLVIDVRPEDEYRAGHLPGARSIPLRELEQKLVTLPRGQEIVAYCRGPYCVLAIKAVALLRRHGFQAVRLEDGVTEWRAAGLPVEAGAKTASGVRRPASGRKGRS